jgi:hypothetical protein
MQDNINQDIEFSKKQASLCNKHVKWIEQIFFSKVILPICGIKYFGFLQIFVMTKLFLQKIRYAYMHL